MECALWKAISVSKAYPQIELSTILYCILFVSSLEPEPGSTLRFDNRTGGRTHSWFWQRIVSLFQLVRWCLYPLRSSCFQVWLRQREDSRAASFNVDKCYEHEFESFKVFNTGRSQLKLGLPAGSFRPIMLSWTFADFSTVSLVRQICFCEQHLDPKLCSLKFRALFAIGELNVFPTKMSRPSNQSWSQNRRIDLNRK